tara:strand:+ start:419 stop:697 length:279 start_codon:yes stop_codon:yes gene_type:complete
MKMKIIFDGAPATFAMGLQSGRLRHYVRDRFEGDKDTKAGAILHNGKIIAKFSGVGVDNFVTHAQDALDCITQLGLISCLYEDKIDVYMEEE